MPKPTDSDHPERPSSRPDYVLCIAHNHADDKGTTWCGRTVPHSFVFTDIDHATYNARNEGRLLTCPDCVEAVTSLLKEHTL